MKENQECNHEWSTGITLYDSPKCDKCGKIFEHQIPD